VIVAATICWGGLTGAYVYFLRTQRNFTTAEFGDAFLPSRWSDLRRKRGEYYLAAAERHLLSRNPAEGLYHLRVGLGLAPTHLPGRLLQARIFHTANRPEFAARTLIDGLPHHAGNASYALTTLQYLLDTGQDTLAIKQSDLLLAQSRWNRPERATFAKLAARAALHLGRYPLSEQYLSTHCDANDPTTVWLRASANLDLGYRNLACYELENTVADGTADSPIFDLLATEYRRDGLKAREALLLAQALAAAPLAWPSRLAYIRHHHAYRDAARLPAETAAYLRDFANDEQALLALADFCATAGQPAAAVQARVAAEAQGRFALVPFLLLEAEARSVAGEHQACLQLLEASPVAAIDPGSPYYPALLGLRAAACFGLRRLADGHALLDQLLALKTSRPDNLAAIAARLAGFGLIEERRRLLDQALNLDPRNQRILADRLRLELDHGFGPRLPELAQIYVNLPRPGVDLLTRLRATLGGDRFLLNPYQTALLAALDHAAAPRAR